MRRVLALCLVLSLSAGCIGFAQQLSGSWNLQIDIDPQQTSFSDSLAVYSILKVSYMVGDWTFGTATVLDETGWRDQDFSTTGRLGPFTLTGAVDFNPDATFGSLTTTTSVAVAGVLLGSQFTLEGDDTFLTVTGSRYVGDVDVSINANFGDNDGICNFPFDQFSVYVGFPFCCSQMASSLIIGCDGFEQIAFSSSGITIPALPWLIIGARIVYTMQTKSLTLSPTFDFDTVTCIDFYVDVDTSDNLTINTITIEGIKLSSNMGEVTFTGLSFWGEGGKPGRLSGTEYWEVYTIETNADACCGPLSFNVSVFFLEGGLRLFDVSLFDVNLQLTVASQFVFSMGLEMDVDVIATLWTLGFVTAW